MIVVDQEKFLNDFVGVISLCDDKFSGFEYPMCIGVNSEDMAANPVDVWCPLVKILNTPKSEISGDPEWDFTDSFIIQLNEPMGIITPDTVSLSQETVDKILGFVDMNYDVLYDMFIYATENQKNLDASVLIDFFDSMHLFFSKEDQIDLIKKTPLDIITFFSFDYSVWLVELVDLTDLDCVDKDIPFIKVSNNKGLMTPDDSFVFSLTETPRLLTPSTVKLPEEQVQRARNWIVLNYDVINEMYLTYKDGKNHHLLRDELKSLEEL